MDGTTTPQYQHESQVSWFRVLVSVFIVLTAHAICLRNQFVDFDDDTIFLNNKLITVPFYEMLSNVFDWSRPDTWRPIRDLSHWLDWAVHGQSPMWAHAHNLLLLAVIVVLVRTLLARWQLRAMSADLITVIAFVHPIQVEVITWVSGRKDLLAGVFFF